MVCTPSEIAAACDGDARLLYGAESRRVALSDLIGTAATSTARTNVEVPAACRRAPRIPSRVLVLSGRYVAPFAR